MKPSALEETLNNAKRCISNKIYCHTDSHRNTGVVFNISGQMLGLILQSQYVPADNLSQDDKVGLQNLFYVCFIVTIPTSWFSTCICPQANAPKLLASAFEHWEEEVEHFDDQTSLLQMFPKLSSSTSSSNSAIPECRIGNDMIEELYEGNIEIHINDNGAGSSENVFGSITCLGNIDELRYLLERQPNEPSQATDCSSNEPRDGTLAKEKVRKKWKVLVNIVKWLTQRTERRDVAILVVQVQKKPRRS